MKIRKKRGAAEKGRASIFVPGMIRGSSPQDSKVLVDDFEIPILFHALAFRAIVPAEVPGIETIRDVGTGVDREGHGHHGYLRYNDVRVPADHVLGGEGNAFVIAQTRLGGGRIHHAMRTIAEVRKAFDMMCERAVSRQTRKTLLEKRC